MSDANVTGLVRINPESQIAADVNAGFAFFLDCVVNLFVFAGILLGVFGFPGEIVFGKIIPGCIVGILMGNLLNVAYTRRLVKNGADESLTSIPLGIDLPTIIGMALFVMGPAYLAGGGDMAAAETAWHIGIAAALWMGVVKIGLSFFSRQMQSKLPQMALIGAMAAVATVWLGANAVLDVFALPAVGLLSLAIMIYALMGGHKLPFGLPAAVVAIVLGTGLYYMFAGFGVTGYSLIEIPSLTPALPMPTLGGFEQLFSGVSPYIGIVIPFALLIAASAVNVVAGAKVVGDDYDPRKVIQMDAVTTIVMALFGGPAQTTPYFGHATYKRMGARTNYALGVAIVVTILGFSGVIALASELVPRGVLAPILVVVASDILRLCLTGNAVHAPGLLMAIIPGILYYTKEKINLLLGEITFNLEKAGLQLSSMLSPESIAGFQHMSMLSNGYIMTSLLWGSLTVWILDGQFRKAAGAFAACALFTWFGVIHSVADNAGMYLPWAMADLGGRESVPGQVAVAYLVAGAIIYALSFTAQKKPSESA